MKNNKNKIKSLMILFLCIIIVIIYTIIRIYALFYSESMAKVQLKNGVWNIIVNGTDITKGENINFLIDNVSTFENEHVKPGNLAPGLTGFFKIGIDPQHTDVSIKYEISLNQEELTNSNIIIKSITETKEGNKPNKMTESSNCCAHNAAVCEENQCIITKSSPKMKKWLQKGCNLREICYNK